MPTRTTSQRFAVTNSDYRNGTPTGVSTSTSTLITYQKTTPTTVYRKFPEDLYAMGTARTVSSVIQNCSTISSGYTPSISDYRVITGQSAAGFWNTSYGIAPDPPSIDVEAMRNHIRMRMRGDATNLAMALSEYRKTAALFGALARGVASKGKTLAGAVKARKGIAKTYLGFQYGVKPLVSDILGSVEDLKNACNQPIYISGVETRRANSITRTEVNHKSTFYDIPGVMERHAQKRVRLQWRAKYDPSYVFNTLVAHGFANPFAVAYNLVPYSFVIDWWINLGDVLASLDNLLLFDTLSASTSTRDVSAWYLTSPGYNRSGGRRFVDPHHWTRITRTDTRGVPIHMSMVVTPKYKPSVSLQHILNGLALLHVARDRF